MEVCIYSGTFNPVHNAHIRVAESVVSELNLDKLILIPNNIPPHKLKENLMSPKDRLEMLRLAFDDERFVVSDIEFCLGGKSYSLNTVKEIKKLYNVKGRIGFIIGTDAFRNLKSWYRFEELVPLVKFIIVPRENDADIDRIAESLGLKDLQYKVIDLPFVDISSSNIRNFVKRGESLEDLVPLKVEEYIKEKDLFANFTFDEIKVLLEQNFSADMSHSIAVSDMSVELAIRFGADENKARLAGVLHDCAKRLSLSDMQDLIKENGIHVLPQEKNAPRTLHAPLGAFITKSYFKIDDIEVLEAIRFHTIGRENMTLLDKVVFLADKIEPVTREVGFRGLIEPALEKGLDEAILRYFELLIQKLKDEGQKITPYTKGVLRYFKSKV